MNPKVKYTFKSMTGRTVTITSRLGEDAARGEAMIYFWGPSTKYRGSGLDLISQQEIEEKNKKGVNKK